MINSQRVTQVKGIDYVPSDSVQWGTNPVPECRRDQIQSIYNVQGVYTWSDGNVTEGRQVVKMVDTRCTGYNDIISGMWIGEVKRSGSKWQAYDIDYNDIGVFATKSAAAARMYDIARQQRNEVAA